MNEIINGNNMDVLPTLDDDSIDLLLTDPPYGIKFMGKSWDKALPDIDVWRQCLRVLKPGSFGFVMSIPRQDCLSRMIINLEDAGFLVNFSPIIWTFATGFPKAANIAKIVDKRLGESGEVVDTQQITGQALGVNKGLGLVDNEHKTTWDITRPVSPEAQALNGSYANFQPKPCYENIICCAKKLTPIAELTIIATTTVQLLTEVLSWYDVSSVEKISNLTQTQRDYIVQRVVRGNLVEEARTQTGKVAGYYGLMDMLKSTLDLLQNTMINTNLSIDLLWKSILVGLLSRANKFTTSMMIEQITELKTLNSLLSQVISANSMQANETPQNGVRLNVTVVESYLTSALTRLLSLNQTGVPSRVGNNIKKEAENGQLPANNADNNLLLKARESSANIVPANVIISQVECDQIVKSQSVVDIAVQHLGSSPSASSSLKQESSIAAAPITLPHSNRSEVAVALVVQKPFTDKHTRSDVYKMIARDYWYTGRTEVTDTNIEKLTNKWNCSLVIGDVIERRLALHGGVDDAVLINRDVVLKSSPFRDTDITSSVTHALATGKGVTWLDDGRIPIALDDNIVAKNPHTVGCIGKNGIYGKSEPIKYNISQGRFAANLLVSDNILDDGRITKSGVTIQPVFESKDVNGFQPNPIPGVNQHNDSGGYSRYFSLDAWAEKNLPESASKVFPFLIVPKPSPGEKNAGLDELDDKQMYKCDNSGESLEIFGTTDGGRKARKNNHATVKPITLGSYLVSIGSRPGDVVLDPYCGSGSFCISAAITDRKYIGIELDAEMVDISRRRIEHHIKQPDLF